MGTCLPLSFNFSKKAAPTWSCRYGMKPGNTAALGFYVVGIFRVYYTPFLSLVNVFMERHFKNGHNACLEKKLPLTFQKVLYGFQNSPLNFLFLHGFEKRPDLGNNVLQFHRCEPLIDR